MVANALPSSLRSFSRAVGEIQLQIHSRPLKWIKVRLPGSCLKLCIGFCSAVKSAAESDVLTAAGCSALRGTRGSSLHRCSLDFGADGSLERVYAAPGQSEWTAWPHIREPRKSGSGAFKGTSNIKLQLHLQRLGRR